MDNNKKYFDSPEFGRLLQRYERSLQMGKDEYFESDELSDIAEYYYDKKDKPRAEYVLDYAMRSRIAPCFQGTHSTHRREEH